MKTFIVSNTAKALGAGHLIAQTTADVLVHLEANMCHKFLGNDKEETKTHRLNKTDDHQKKMAAMWEAKSFKAKATKK